MTNLLTPPGGDCMRHEKEGQERIGIAVNLSVTEGKEWLFTCLLGKERNGCLPVC